MKYNNISRAIFLRRPNRFIAEVEIGGRKEMVHVKNTGRLGELLIPGSEVWVTEPGTPGRKTRYDLVAVRKGTGVLFNIDSQAPNQVVKEWLAKQDFDRVIPECTYGESRIDFYMERRVAARDHAECWAGNGQDHAGSRPGPEDLTESHEHFLMEVKGCTQEFDGIGYFPDAPTERGVKHLRELARAAGEGYRAYIAFVIQMDGVSEVRPNVATHPEFGVALEEAQTAGVKILYLRCHVEPDSLEIVEAICK